MKKSNFLLTAAAVILGLTAIYWLIQAFGLIFRGRSFNEYGLYLILPILMIALLILGRRRLLLSGIIVATMSVLLAVYFLMVKLNLYDATPFLLLMCVPLAISGLLYIEADWSRRRKEP